MINDGDDDDDDDDDDDSDDDDDDDVDDGGYNCNSDYKGSKAKQNNLYLLIQAGFVAAIQLMWACSITARALRITSEYSFTDVGRMDS